MIILYLIIFMYVNKYIVINIAKVLKIKALERRILINNFSENFM